MRWIWFLLALGPAAAEIQDVMKSAEIDRAFASVKKSKVVHEKPNYMVAFEARKGKGAVEIRPEADQMLFVRKGAATLTLHGSRAYDIKAGDFIHIPRKTKYRFNVAKGRVEWIAVRILSEKGAHPYDRRTMADVLTQREVADTFARFDRNQPIHTSPTYTMNYVIYTGKTGPWESHAKCVDIYFVHVGEATARLGGEIQGAKEESPGEIRGTGVVNAREHKIGSGDLVLIPRNGAHFMQPSTPKLGYVLLKVWAE